MKSLQVRCVPQEAHFYNELERPVATIPAHDGYERRFQAYLTSRCRISCTYFPSEKWASHRGHAFRRPALDDVSTAHTEAPTALLHPASPTIHLGSSYGVMSPLSRSVLDKDMAGICNVESWGAQAGA